MFTLEVVGVGVQGLGFQVRETIIFLRNSRGCPSQHLRQAHSKLGNKERTDQQRNTNKYGTYSQTESQQWLPETHRFEADTCVVGKGSELREERHSVQWACQSAKLMSENVTIGFSSIHSFKMIYLP